MSRIHTHRERPIARVFIHPFAWIGVLAVVVTFFLSDIAKEEIVFVGDGMNDLPAFHHAGFCVAMGNAVPELKKAAHYICPPIGEDGIIDVIKKVILPRRI